MSALFIEVLNMSLSALYVALIVMLVRLLIKKAPKKYAYMLWSVVLLRLIFPFSIELPVSAVPIRQQTIPQDIIYAEKPSIQSGITTIDNTMNLVIERTLPPASSSASVKPMQTLLEVGAYIWLVGFAVLLLFGTINYLRLKKRVRTAIRVEDNIYETDQINTPFVMGFIRPIIYIPVGIEENERGYIITHEQVHIKRLDFLLKPLAFLVTVFHWFNPIVWVSYLLMTKDMELSADESVMKNSSTDIRGDYSNSMLAISIKKSGLLTPLAFGETGVKERVKNVLHYKKPALWVSIVTVVIVALVSVFLWSSKTVSPIESVQTESHQNDNILLPIDYVSELPNEVPLNSVDEEAELWIAEVLSQQVLPKKDMIHLYSDVLKDVIIEFKKDAFGEAYSYNELPHHLDLPYYLYDMDEDGIKELIVKKGRSEANYIWAVYTISGGAINFVGDFNGTQSHGLYKRLEGGIYSHWGHMGDSILSRITLANGKLFDELVAEENIYLTEGSGSDYSWLEEIKWAYVTDFSLINNHEPI